MDCPRPRARRRRLPRRRPRFPKGVADILVEAFQLYRKHGKALLLTCALLFVPASLVKSCALAALARPEGPADCVVAELQSAQARAAASGRALADAYARHADPATISRLQRDNREELERIATEAFGAGQNGWGEFGVAILGFLGMAMTMFFLYGVIVPLTNGALTVAVADRILGGNAGPREVWMLLLRRVDKLLGAMIPAALLVALGFVFLFIPGIVLAVLFAFVSPVVLVEGLTGRAALRRSVDLVKSDWLRVALVGVTFAVLQAVARTPSQTVSFRTRRCSSIHSSRTSSRWCCCPSPSSARCSSTSTSAASATTSPTIAFAPT